MGSPSRLAFSVLLLVLLASASARACSCYPRTLTPESSLADWNWVGSGTVISSEGWPYPGGLRYINTIEVQQIWKGPYSRTLYLVTTEALGDCGRGKLPVGNELLIFAHTEFYPDWGNSYYTTDSCDLTQGYTDAMGEMLGPPLYVGVHPSSWGTFKASY